VRGVARLFDPRAFGVPFKLALIAGLGLAFLDDVGALGDARRSRAPALCLLGGLLCVMEGEGWTRARAEQWRRSFGTPLALGGVARSVVALVVLWAVIHYTGERGRGAGDLAFGLTGVALAWNERGRRALARGPGDAPVPRTEVLVPVLVAALLGVPWVGPSSGLVIVVALATGLLAARRARVHGSAALSP
jgi:hypothetical protein